MLQRSYLISQINDEDIHLYKMVTHLVMSFEDKNNSVPKTHKTLLNCHAFARALAFHVKGLKVVDGYYIGILKNKSGYHRTSTEHSWLVTPNGAIIEPFATGFLSMTPILIPTKENPEKSHSSHYFTTVRAGREIRKKVLTPVMKEKISRAKAIIKECIEDDKKELARIGKTNSDT